MALDQHGALLKMVVIVSQHHFTGRPCWSWLSWLLGLSTRLWDRAPRRHKSCRTRTRHGQYTNPTKTDACVASPLFLRTPTAHSGTLLPTSPGHCPPPTGKILGATNRHEPRAVFISSYRIATMGKPSESIRCREALHRSGHRLFQHLPGPRPGPT
jgi:hypothetical protein